MIYNSNDITWKLFNFKTQFQFRKYVEIKLDFYIKITIEVEVKLLVCGAEKHAHINPKDRVSDF